MRSNQKQVHIDKDHDHVEHVEQKRMDNTVLQQRQRSNDQSGWMWSSGGDQSTVPGTGEKGEKGKKNKGKKESVEEPEQSVESEVKSRIRELGMTDALFEELFDRPEWLDAAFDVKPFSKLAQLFKKLNRSTLSDDVVQRFPQEAI